MWAAGRAGRQKCGLARGACGLGPGSFLPLKHSSDVDGSGFGGLGWVRVRSNMDGLGPGWVESKVAGHGSTRGSTRESLLVEI